MLSCRGRLLKERARLHGIWAVEEGGVDLLMIFVDYAGGDTGGGSGGSGGGGVNSNVIRQKASMCLGRVINAMSDPSAVAAAAAAATATAKQHKTTTTPPPIPPSSAAAASSSSSKPIPPHNNISPTMKPPPTSHSNAHLDGVKAILTPYLTPSINYQQQHHNQQRHAADEKLSPSNRRNSAAMSVRPVETMVTSDRIEVS